ncbi:hypothetical protein [Larkinella soli]|nr:hypothetical protein [Larkinella soli]
MTQENPEDFYPEEEPETEAVSNDSALDPEIVTSSTQQEKGDKDK